MQKMRTPSESGNLLILGKLFDEVLRLDCSLDLVCNRIRLGLKVDTQKEGSTFTAAVHESIISLVY